MHGWKSRAIAVNLHRDHRPCAVACLAWTCPVTRPAIRSELAELTACPHYDTGNRCTTSPDVGGPPARWVDSLRVHPEMLMTSRFRLLVFTLLPCLIVFSAAACAGLPLDISAIPAPVAPDALAALLPTLTPEPGATPPILDTGAPAETVARGIPLAGPAAQRNAEFSAMAWYGDTLILLPQYPDFTADGQSNAYALPKAQIIAWLDGATAGPLAPTPIAFDYSGVAEWLPGFEGFESLAFDGDIAYATTEVTANGQTAAWLVRGSVDADNATIRLDPSTLVWIPPQTALFNFSDEALLVTPGGGLLTLYEVNGAGWNPSPLAHRFAANLAALEPVPAPATEYRITDATTLDADGRFWVINVYFPGEEFLSAPDDLIAAQYGEGPTHAAQEQVERLLEYAYDGAQVVRTDTPPIQLALTLLARNWEGIARLDDRGFLLVTDQFPETILAFVPR